MLYLWICILNSALFNYFVYCTIYVVRLVWLCYITVSSGSIAVNADSSVQILAEEACLLEDIDIQVGLYINSFTTQCSYWVNDVIVVQTFSLI